MTDTDTNTIILVALDDLVVDPTKNCRRETGPTDDLIAADSFYHPLLVRPRADGRYDLIIGFRRHAAAVQKGWPHVPCRLWFGDELERAVANIRENLDRRNLTTWETAQACRRLVLEHHLSASDAAKRTGMTVANVNNHLRCLRALEPSIQREWERNHPAAGVDFLRELAVLPHDQQLERWNERVGRVVPRPPMTRPAAAPAPAPAGRPTKRTIEKVATLIDKTDESEDWRRGAAAALDFVLGRRRGLGTYQRRRKTRRAARGAGKGNGNAEPNSSRGPVAAAAV